jgi:hypothetical protein
MGCCGKARANLSYSRVPRLAAPNSSLETRPPLPRPAALVANGAAGRPVALQFQGSSSIVVRGPATGVSYTFSPMEPLRNVNARDASVLLRTGSFRLIQGA